jgi:hypothetical protein
MCVHLVLVELDWAKLSFVKFVYPTICLIVDCLGSSYVVMLCYVMLCYVMLCYVMLCYVMLCWLLEQGKLSGITLGYRLDDRGFESLQGLGIVILTTVSRPALGTTQSPIQWVKRLGREADHSPPSSAEVKNVWSYTPIPSMSMWRGAQLKHRDNFTLPYLTKNSV